MSPPDRAMAAASGRARKVAPARPRRGRRRARSGAALAGVFAALGDPTRLALVAALGAGATLSIAQLTAGTSISRQGVTKHLQVLADAGVVRDVRSGRERRWRLDPRRIAAARRTLDDIGRDWDEALGKLKAFAEAL